MSFKKRAREQFHHHILSMIFQTKFHCLISFLLEILVIVIIIILCCSVYDVITFRLPVSLYSFRFFKCLCLFLVKVGQITEISNDLTIWWSYYIFLVRFQGDTETNFPQKWPFQFEVPYLYIYISDFCECHFSNINMVYCAKRCLFYVFEIIGLQSLVKMSLLNRKRNEFLKIVIW